jgi:hypothetical protein
MGVILLNMILPHGWTDVGGNFILKNGKILLL